MADNFWEAKLNEKDELVEPKKEDESKRKAIASVAKADVDLADFPVETWDSDSAANEIVSWYNANRLATEQKTLAEFKELSGIKRINSTREAQQLLDTAITTLQDEGCTVWNKPHQLPDSGTLKAKIGGLAIGWVFVIIWCGLSLIVTIFMGGSILSDIGTEDWTPTDGIITDSGVDISSSSEGGDTYCLWVTYNYTIDNMTYDGYLVSHSQESSCDSWSSDADAEYPPGSEITVYVNPDSPYEAVLETGLAAVPFMMFFFFLFPLVGVVILLGMLRATILTIKNEIF
tara:strand:+ start:1841 stop:2704 length:864 start_codon:yes stop_codon:yes gene_type:complete